MMKRLTQWVSMILLVFGAVGLNAQVQVSFPTTGNNTFVNPGGPGTIWYQFYDNGGAAGAYTAFNGVTFPGTFAAGVLTASNWVTFRPSAPCNRVRATFTSFVTEGTFDALYVFNGAGPVLLNSAAGGAPYTPNTPALIASPLAQLNTPMAGGWIGNGLALAPTSPSVANGGTAGVVTASGIGGALTFMFSADVVTCAGWAANIDELLGGGIDVALSLSGVPAVVVGAADPLTCAANVAVNGLIVNYPSSGCPLDVQLQYSLNGGPFTNAGGPLNIDGSPAANPFPAVNFSNLPVGSGTIAWRVIGVLSGSVLATGSSLLQVADTAPPTFTNCPASTTINLGPGECDVVFTYPCISATDCGLWPSTAVLDNVKIGRAHV